MTCMGTMLLTSVAVVGSRVSLLLCVRARACVCVKFSQLILRFDSNMTVFSRLEGEGFYNKSLSSSTVMPSTSPSRDCDSNFASLHFYRTHLSLVLYGDVGGYVCAHDLARSSQKTIDPAFQQGRDGARRFFAGPDRRGGGTHLLLPFVV